MLRIHRLAAVWLLSALLITVGCATKVQVPPRVQLAEWQRIGLVGFRSNSAPELAEVATREFMEILHAAQPGARILELGLEARVLAAVGQDERGLDAMRAIGERFQVDAIFVGDIELSEAKPSLRIGRSFSTVKARADITGDLSSRLIETGSGATIWSRSSTASANVARVGISTQGIPSFGATDPDNVHSKLVRQLVSDLRYDFHPTWQKQR